MKEIATICGECGGTGKVCNNCGWPQKGCECRQDDETGRRGYDPVVCDECGGTGEAK